ncbi:hypothetical protein D3C78_31260 [compost metagenome]
MGIFVELILWTENDTFLTFLSHFEDTLLLCRLKSVLNKKPELEGSGFFYIHFIQQNEFFFSQEFYQRAIRAQKATTLEWPTSP